MGGFERFAMTLSLWQLCVKIRTGTVFTEANK